MTQTTLTEDQRIDLIAAMVAAMVKRGDVFEDQMIETRNDLMAASDEDLLEAAEELGIEMPGDSRPAGF